MADNNNRFPPRSPQCPSDELLSKLWFAEVDQHVCCKRKLNNCEIKNMKSKFLIKCYRCTGWLFCRGVVVLAECAWRATRPKAHECNAVKTWCRLLLHLNAECEWRTMPFCITLDSFIDVRRFVINFRRDVDREKNT